MAESQTKRCYSADAEGVPDLCKACSARHGGVCGALSGRQLTELSKSSVRRTLRGGAELSAINEQDGSFANILSGVVKLSKLLQDGRQQIVGLQFAPDFVGRPYGKEEGLFAEAVTEVELCSFSKGLLERMIAETPGLEHHLYQQALAELDEARDLLLTLGRKTAREKVATFLLTIARHIRPFEVQGHSQDGDRSVSFALPLTRGEMADFLGLTIETVSRQLTKLKLSGLIRIEKNRVIVIPDSAALQEAAGD